MPFPRVNIRVRARAADLPIGEKLWHDRGRVMQRSVTSTEGDTTTVRIETAGEFTGVGRAAGIDGKYVATGIALRGKGNVRSASFQEIFTTSGGETILIQGNQLGKLDQETSKVLSILTFSTASERISWINDLILIREGYNDPDDEEFSGSISEWL